MSWLVIVMYRAMTLKGIYLNERAALMAFAK